MASGMSHVKKVQAHVEVQRRFIVKKTKQKKNTSSKQQMELKLNYTGKN